MFFPMEAGTSFLQPGLHCQGDALTVHNIWELMKRSQVCSVENISVSQNEHIEGK